MDTYEATKVVMSRVQTLDPENASKIMGYILIQDQGEKEMIRLAFVPESLLLSYINQAKARLGILSNNFPRTTPRISIPNGEFHLSNPPSPANSFPRNSPRPFSYAAALSVNGASPNNNGAAASPNNGSSLHFYGGNGSPDPASFYDDLADPIMSPSGRSDSVIFEDVGGVPSPHYHPFHRRSCSVNDAAFLEDGGSGGGGGGGGGFGWRPCMYFARGFCKNGNSCKFLHGEEEMGSPSKNGHGFEEVLRMKVIQQQRLAVLASRGHHSFDYSKCMDFFNENPRNEFSPMGLGGSSSSRQIYLTFPADSYFKEDDVSNYFSMFGPVQDVRIPYQQKRMFGFVTFIYPETVKLILAKGNPHFVCDSRVLVKPYKEKGKVAEKKQQQHNLDLSPSGIDSMEHIDLPFGTRMLLSSQEMMLKRKIEQEAELQHAIQLEGRRMMNLQLMDLKNQSHNQHLLQSFRAGMPFSSPRQSQQVMDRNLVAAPDGMNLENSEDFDGRQEAPKTSGIGADEKLIGEGMQYPKQQNVNGDDSDFPESFLPDNLFASPTKLSAERQSAFSQVDDNIPPTVASSNNNTPTLPGMASLKSCYIQMPRFSSGQEAIEM